jgi:AcrR family transcriptional regulator
VSTAQARLDQVISAALTVFGRYGYQHTSMDLIAKAAGISRPALYQHFSGKDDIFRATGERLADELIAAAETAAGTDGSSADRLYCTLAVKLDLTAESVGAPFRRDLVAEASARLPDLQAATKARHAAVIEKLLTSAVDLDLAATAISAPDIAVLLLDALAGIAQQDDHAGELRRRLRHLVSLTTGSLRR